MLSYSLCLGLVLLVSVSFGERLYTQPSFSNKGASVTPSYGITPTTGKKGALTSPTPTAPTGPANPFNLTFVVAARDLPVKKKGAKVDPYIKVSHRTGTLQEAKDWAPIGQTETLKENNSPDFLKVFTFEWTKGKNQQWHFEVKGKHTITKDEALGTADIKIDEYVLQKNQEMTIPLSNGGSLIVKKVQPVTFRLFARMVPKMDAFNGASDPFVECFWRFGNKGNDTLFYTTKVVEDSENPDWNETIEFKNYQKGKDMWWHFKVHDQDSVSGNDFVGEALVEVDPFVLKRAAQNKKLSTDPKNKATLTITPA
ncbi:rasGAP-activating-like protein 1 [Folsomia candida]|uniref:Copine-7 n=1 Tax=Folsomia candida TaxID=158441 RepID=A0A226EPX1_FOLCA|nr:rasGAP-activating-like protein 1 [Folsomia candida]OXA59672.1 Copine-7 [Folsomia candida]